MLIRIESSKGLFALLVISWLTGPCTSDVHQRPLDYTSWSEYLGGPDRNHFSTLSQITLDNVTDLAVAWSYETKIKGQMQMNPIIIDTILYGVDPAKQPVAIHAKTGKEIWTVEESVKKSASRGVAYWSNATEERILYVSDSYLYAVNAKDGEPIKSFGEDGKVDMRIGLPQIARDKYLTSTTPGTIYGDIIILPTRVSEGRKAAPGDILAFNIISGELAWVFHTIPYPSEQGYDTWQNKEAYKNAIIGGANNWAGMAIDKGLGIVYVPTGSCAPDFYGGDRKGANLYANSLLALDASSGERLWHFQFVHHDIWDRDPPAPPNLITVKRNGKEIAAVAQITKQGYIFVFDRKTGEPLFEIEEVEVPTSNLIGEEAWPTQPIPNLPKPFARQSNTITVDEVNPYTKDKLWIKDSIANMNNSVYVPPGLDPVLLLPGYDGGAEWGGAGADPSRGILYINSNEMPWILQMRTNNQQDDNLGYRSYLINCSTCHGSDRRGIPSSDFPSLLGLSDNYSTDYVTEVIINGQGKMPGFPQLSQEEHEALMEYIMDIDTPLDSDAISNKKDHQDDSFTSDLYLHTGYRKFLDSDRLPVISPPWGTLHAIDLNDGSYIWSVPFGETPSLVEQGITNTGTENYGGPLITENGLLFIGATKDGYFRAYNRHTGKAIWQYKLPAPAFATPSTYEVDGKQYIVIACGGEKLGTEKGNQIIAFALE